MLIPINYHFRNWRLSWKLWNYGVMKTKFSTEHVHIFELLLILLSPTQPAVWGFCFLNLETPYFFFLLFTGRVKGLVWLVLPCNEPNRVSWVSLGYWTHHQTLTIITGYFHRPCTECKAGNNTFLALLFFFFKLISILSFSVSAENKWFLEQDLIL